MQASTVNEMGINGPVHGGRSADEGGGVAFVEPGGGVSSPLGERRRSPRCATASTPHDPTRLGLHQVVFPE
jgi:hypothetical protein